MIRHVIDGDTVIFGDGEHVRMIGIDTPELGADGAPEQPGAAAARDWVAVRLGRGTSVLADRDQENRDRHGRLLRHLFLADGTNLQAGLLSEGLAMPLTIPPSLGHLTCYRDAAAAAERAGAGLWGRPEYRPMAPGALAATTRGYRIIQSSVIRVRPFRGNILLQLDGPLSVTIPSSSLAAFDQALFDMLAGEQVEVRGMVYPYRGRLQMYVRHPLDLRRLDVQGNPAGPQASK